MEIRRRRFLLLLGGAPLLRAGVQTGKPIRGKLTKAPADKPALQIAGGRLLLLTGDDDTVGVLRDARLAGADFEVVGQQSGDTVAIDPIETAALFAYRDGKRLRVTYWCDICAIRTYTPGLCWCCRQETQLDLRPPDKVDGK